MSSEAVEKIMAKYSLTRDEADEVLYTWFGSSICAIDLECLHRHLDELRH